MKRSEAPPFKLIVGLGNPGPEYQNTRHNAGFWFLDEVAASFGGSFRAEKRFFADFAKIQASGNDIILLKPQTFMNRSGQSVRAASSYYKISPEQVLVVHDELDLPPGVIKVKQAGGHGGHNGLRDTISSIGKEFWRIRIGIGHPGHKDDVVGFVLKRAAKNDQQLIDDAIYRGVKVFDGLIEKGRDKAIQELHSHKL